VTDQASAVIPGAKVTVTNEGTRFTRTVETNQNGQYVVTSFPPGRLRLEVQVPGFQKLIREGVELTAADTLTVNLQLQVGSVEQTIEVTGAAPLLQTQTASVSSLVTNQQILETPLNGRSFTQLLQLMPARRRQLQRSRRVAPATAREPTRRSASTVRRAGTTPTSSTGCTTRNCGSTGW
jgi:hypothetical protein